MEPQNPEVKSEGKCHNSQPPQKQFYQIHKHVLPSENLTIEVFLRKLSGRVKERE